MTTQDERTKNEALRLTTLEQRRGRQVRQYVPEAGDNTAQLNKYLWRRGLLLTEAEVVAAGGPLPPGVTLAELTTAVARMVQAVLPLLQANGRVFVASALVGIEAEPASASAPPGEDEVDPGAADDLASMGSGLL
jgi:hypothetical protein